MTPAGLPHSDTPGSQLGCQLPRAYRRLQRPSSALDAKASTMCPSQLVSQTLNKNHKETQPHHPHNQEGNEATTKRIKQQPTPPKRAQIAVRCSRPLSTCQTPTPPTPTPPPPGAAQGKEGTRKTSPTPTTTGRGSSNGPDLSGPTA
jgi:hypothetical protein